LKKRFPYNLIHLYTGMKRWWYGGAEETTGELRDALFSAISSTKNEGSRRA